MTAYSIRIEIQDGEVEKILKEMEEAQNKIYDCYSRLRDMGVVTVSGTKKDAPET